jgi:[acyl-carrier-protein] S-malonyltransferase
MAKVAFLFPGQGAQFVGMGKGLYDELPAARALFDRANELLGFDLKGICFDGPAEALEATDVSQPAIYVASLAALESLRASNASLVESAAGAAGLSLGEYTALVFAGSLDFETGLHVVRRRGEAMQAAAVAIPSGMASVLGLDEAAIEQLCERVAPEGKLWKANLLGPGNIIVSGEKAAIEAVGPLAIEMGSMKVIPLAVAGGFHCPIMQSGAASLKEVLNQVGFGEPRIPVYSNVDTNIHYEPQGIRLSLLAQVVQPVLWEQSMRQMLSDGFDTFYEIGPGRVLTGLLKRIERKIPCTSVPAR